jgi:hypothetical protein
MSKRPMSKIAEGHHFPCPNPNCDSKVFVSEANRNKHFGAKPDCLEYARQVCAQMMLKQQAALTDQKVYTDVSTNDNSQAGQLVLPLEFPDTNEVEDIDFPMGDTTNHLADYENSGFVNPEYDQLDLPGYQTTYTKSQQVEVCLLKLCTEMETPLYAFEEIMKWARHAFIEGYEFMPRQSTYRTQIDKLEIWMGMENQRPEEVSVDLPGINGAIDVINVTRFDFTTQLRSLLDDPVLNRDENLVLNPLDRFQKYTPPDGRLGECLSGSWYNHAWDEMVNDGVCNFMIPIILYIDKTQISISGKLSIFPVQMSLGIFTEKASPFPPHCKLL